MLRNRPGEKVREIVSLFGYFCLGHTFHPGPRDPRGGWTHIEMRHGENLRTKLPKLSGDQKDLLEGKLTLEECRRALMCLRCGTHPVKTVFP